MKQVILAILTLLFILPMFAQAGDRITGVWYNGERSSKIEISQAKDGSFIGKIIWLKEPNDAAGNPKKDSKNSDAELAKRPLMNLQILSGLSYNGKSKYSGGKIYDPKSGKTYSAKAEMTNNNTLALRGFIGIALAGRTDTWIRTTK
ncbi:MAG: DUF2147 domain-containing protein [Candidatus Cloacimonetes bacterium]|jgi:uncharacterized protein (DUF2147 family)|nr:DUF2147 domain-containing protein [Candidatus Cloacimonadota bacterium]MDY0337822.1 DUF2147 domain-containing protein [Candidatus Cloacimonadaceae bacterium]MCB5269424.1 DUF2147 domain-containing protein [Candidatus Cloacimonadota bacterium]MCK9334250.1 DUF2147 domain-containing protein [Candidatus Cloacimonadota bacterium]MDD2543711.1 DUF2147 domain-containing protein [Candidatus Cloacimonadota bacterium]